MACIPFPAEDVLAVIVFPDFGRPAALAAFPEIVIIE
jgi:hypothetical protein